MTGTPAQETLDVASTNDERRTRLTVTLTQPVGTASSALTELPTNWLSFWIIVRLFLDGSIRLIGAFTVGDVLSGGTLLVTAAFLIAVGVGLRKRRLWAWKANFIVIFADWFLQPLGNTLNPHPYLYDVAVCGLIWVWPNFVYFRKRRRLFH